MRTLLLCFVTGCERLAFFAAMPLFALYLHTRYGMSESSALLVIGVWNALSYFGALPANVLTDRSLAPRSATFVGCAFLALGYAALASNWYPLLWPALGLQILGHSLFKPNVGALLSELHPSDHSRREDAFLWQHLAVNLGAMLGPLWAEHVRIREHWPMVFLAACGATCVGCIFIEIFPQIKKPPASAAPPFKTLPTERARRRTLWLLCSVATIFWFAAQQASSSLILFAEHHAAQHVTFLCQTWIVRAGHFTSLHSLLVLALLPLFAQAMRWLRQRDAEPSAPMKMMWGHVAMATAFALFSAAGLRLDDAQRSHPAWLASGYLMMSIAEISISPIGLSLIAQLAPHGKRSRTLALWFAAIAAGNLLAGLFGLLWGHTPPHRYFALVALLSLIAAGLLVALLGRLNRAIS